MYEWVRTGEVSGYIDCPAKIGVYLAGGSDVYLIDSGSDRDAGRRVRQILERNGWRLRGILNTHSHADHIGGNRYLQAQTGCAVYSGGMEAAFIRNPVLEPSFLYGGYPCRDLRHKFLMAQESDVRDFSDDGFPKEVEIIPLPGHSFDMVGFRTPDQTVFLADCVSSRATLDKYAISYLYDVEAYLDTLNRVEQMEAAMFVPAHAEPSADVRPLIQLNRERVHAVARRLVELCEAPSTFEELLRRVFDDYGLSMNMDQYVLVGSTVRSYLAWLKDRGALTVAFEGNQMRWKAGD